MTTFNISNEFSKPESREGKKDGIVYLVWKIDLVTCFWASLFERIGHVTVLYMSLNEVFFVIWNTRLRIELTLNQQVFFWSENR